MYRLSLLPRKVLISTDEVINQGPTSATPDPRMLLSAIQIAEERFIKPCLGKDLYYDFREQKNVVVTLVNKDYLEDLIDNVEVVLAVGDIVNAIELVDNDWYVQLWNEHLWKLIAECVVYIASPTNFSQFTAQGEMTNNPKSISFEGDGKAAASVDRKDMEWKLNKMLMDRIDPLIAAMQEWLCDNKLNFPLYKGNCEKGTDGISLKRKTPWVHVYDNKPREKLCD